MVADQPGPTIIQPTSPSNAIKHKIRQTTYWTAGAAIVNTSGTTMTFVGSGIGPNSSMTGRIAINGVGHTISSLLPGKMNRGKTQQTMVMQKKSTSLGDCPGEGGFLRDHLETSNPHPSEARTHVRVLESFVDAARAAEFLCCSRKHVIFMARTAQIPAHPFGGKARRTWLFKLSELDAAVKMASGRLPISNELEAE